MGSGEQVEVEQRQENNHPLDYRFQKDTNEVNILVAKLNAKDFNFQRKGKAKHQNIAIFIVGIIPFLIYKGKHPNIFTLGKVGNTRSCFGDFVWKRDKKMETKGKGDEKLKGE